MLKSSRLPWVDWRWKNVEGKKNQELVKKEGFVNNDETWQGFREQTTPRINGPRNTRHKYDT
jgi:hypothetical protein